jgi:hypothetical protein
MIKLFVATPVKVVDTSCQEILIWIGFQTARYFQLVVFILNGRF